MILSESFELGQFVRNIQRIHETHTSWFKKSAQARAEALDKVFHHLRDENTLADYFMSTSKMKHKSFISRRVSEFKTLLAQVSVETSRMPVLCGTVIDEDSQIEQFLIGVLIPLLGGQGVICAYPEGNPLVQPLKGVLLELSEAVPLHIYTYSDENLDAVEWIIQHPSIKSLYVAQTLPVIKNWALSKIETKDVSILADARHVSIVLDVPSAESSFFESLWNQESQRFRNTRIFALESIFNELVQAIESSQHLYSTKRKDTAYESQLNQFMAETSGRKIELGEGSLTLLTDFSNCSSLHQQVNRAPVVTLTRSKYAHEAVKFANTTPLGWTASVWGDADRAKKIAAGLDYDWVFVNASPLILPSLAFGHAKSSHFGLSGRCIDQIHNFKAQVVI